MTLSQGMITIRVCNQDNKHQKKAIFLEFSFDT